MRKENSIINSFTICSSQRVPDVTEMTTFRSDQEPESNEALIGVIVTLVIVIVGFIVFVFVRKYRRDAAEAKAKLMEEGHPQISLPTLGTQYELNSLLSLNTIGRKDSRQSEFSVTSGVEKPDILDIRVSKYIDGEGEDTVDDINDTLETILNNTSDTLNQSTVEKQKSNETLEPENFQKTPELQILPPSPSPKQRPKSDFFAPESELPPVLPVKV